MDVLPVWLQWAVSFATVLSSIGVLVALVQLRISSKQFDRQLKLTERQFKLTNQGYLQCVINQDFYTTKDEPATQQDLMDPATLYWFLFPVAQLENVGNLPIQFFIDHFTVFFNGTEVYHTPDEILKRTENIIYPKQNLPFMLGRIFFSDQQATLTLQQIQDLKITCKILVTYNDYNDTTKKTVNRELELSGVFLIGKQIHDSLPLLQ